MEFKDIMAISGKPGLYKFVAQGRNSVIVENLETGKRISAFTTERVSSLEEISIFTENEDIPLTEVFKNISDKLEGKEAPGPKSSSDELKTFFTEVLPDYNEERVYVSDIRKIVLWYNLLQRLNLLNELMEALGKDVESKAEEKADAKAEDESEEKRPAENKEE
ncbi:MAG: hypothetical protein GXO83_03535 [Chlorobi bacterium]|nr:hypothetical protein [Chlorobiota bacterium]